jgi:serine/threonine-protein kinase
MKTNPDRIRRLGALFDEALDLDPLAREAFVKRCMDEDTEIGAELERLVLRDQRLIGSKTQSAVGIVEVSLDATEPDALKPGVVVGSYRLEEEVGEGGMGRVFRATRIGPDFSQEVAIKFVRRDLVHPALLKRFSTERAILAALDHPGISRLIDAATTTDGTPFVVMEFVRGRPIVEWCNAHQLTIEARLKLVRKVLAAVAHAHRNLVVHRDIKSSNVLVTDEGETRLLDFGIAKPLGRIGNTDATVTAERFLTPRSAAPEQLEAGAITIACDIHAIGMLLYELLCGRQPFAFDTMTPGEIENAIRHVAPPPMASRVADADLEAAKQRGLTSVRDLRAELRGDLEHIVQRCLRKRPDERYGTIDQLDSDVEHVLEGRPIRERQSDRWYRWRKFVARHKVASGLVAALFVTILLAITAIARQTIAIAHERDRAQRAVGLLKSAFAAANPMQINGANVTARQVLDAARPSLEATFETQPDVYAELGETLAEVELSVGLGQQASELARRATLAARAAGFDDKQIGSLLITEARALIAAGDYDNAKARLHQAADAGFATTPEWKLVQGNLLQHTSQARESVSPLQQAVDETNGRPATDETANLARLQLAQALGRVNRQNEAVTLLDETLRWQRQQLKPDHPRLTLTRIYRIDALRRADRNNEALAEAPAVLQQVLRVFGSRNSVTAIAYAALGNAQNENKQAEDAAESFRHALEASRASVGDDHQNTLRLAFNLAQLLVELGSHDEEIEGLYRDVLVRGGKQAETLRSTLVFWRISFARFLLDRGRAPAALAQLVSPESTEQLKLASGRTVDDFTKILQEAANACGCDDKLAVDPPTDCAAVLELTKQTQTAAHSPGNLQ